MSHVSHPGVVSGGAGRLQGVCLCFVYKLASSSSNEPLEFGYTYVKSERFSSTLEEMMKLALLTQFNP